MNKESPTGSLDLAAREGVKQAIRYHAEHDPGWQYHELATRLYQWADIFTSDLLDPIALPGRDRMPAPILGFERFDHRVLAYYRLGKNPAGVDDEIILNEVHLERSLYSLLETECHELTHLWQQRRGQHPVKPGRNTHNQEFVAKCEAMGLHPFPVLGYHWKPADGNFESLLKRHGIAKPPSTLEVANPKKEKRNWWQEPTAKPEGRSTLTKWSCGCQNVRVGTQEFHARCTLCGHEFAPLNAQPRTSPGETQSQK